MNSRGRLRDHGLHVGNLPTGPHNAITDVPGVLVGHVTLVEGGAVRTGVTAIRPHGGNVFRDRVPAGLAVGNGYGKLAGGTQVQELGELETPVILTNTLSVAAGLDGLIGWTLDQPGNEHVQSVNAVVGETNDGVLNDIRARMVRPEHVRAALEAARPGPAAEGAVGAGTGTVCFGWKGGIGTASRVVETGAGAFTLGVLVQSNFGGHLTVCGAPVWAHLQPPPAAPDGSVMIVLATDAPLSDRNLTRLARRAFLGVGRTGGVMANGSGDYALAFSAAPGVRRSLDAALHHTAELANAALTPLFQAAVDATEEAVLNSLFAAHPITGAGGRTVQALPVDRVLALTRPGQSSGG